MDIETKYSRDSWECFCVCFGSHIFYMGPLRSKINMLAVALLMGMSIFYNYSAIYFGINLLLYGLFGKQGC
jgi:hypothetical protein